MWSNNQSFFGARRARRVKIRDRKHCFNWRFLRRTGQNWRRFLPLHLGAETRVAARAVDCSQRHKLRNGSLPLHRFLQPRKSKEPLRLCGDAKQAKRWSGHKSKRFEKNGVTVVKSGVLADMVKYVEDLMNVCISFVSEPLLAKKWYSYFLLTHFFFFQRFSEDMSKSSWTLWSSSFQALFSKSKNEKQRQLNFTEFVSTFYSLFLLSSSFLLVFQFFFK